jgi:Fic family protein
MDKTLFQTPALDGSEREVMRQIEDIRQRVKYLHSTSTRWSGLLARVTLAKSIQGSNSIEGYLVSDEDAIAAAAGEDPLVDPKSANWLAVSHYRNAMTYILQLADDHHLQWDVNLIRGLHYQMLAYDLERNPGRWRPGSIYVKREATGQTVYTAPDAEAVPSLMQAFVEWLVTESAPSWVTAAMAHLNFVMIHPFRDGNGRMARALQSLVLVRAEHVLDPRFCSIEEYLGEFREPYYAKLAEVGGTHWNPSGDARPFMRFCLKAHLHQAIRLLRYSKYTEYIWNRAEEEATRRGLPPRSILALAEATLGYKIRNATYRALADIKEYLAGRDLKDLVSAGLLVAEGEKRGRVYAASEPLKEIRHEAFAAFPFPKEITDPFTGQVEMFPRAQNA